MKKIVTKCDMCGRTISTTFGYLAVVLKNAMSAKNVERQFCSHCTERLMSPLQALCISEKDIREAHI